MKQMDQKRERRSAGKKSGQKPIEIVFQIIENIEKLNAMAPSRGKECAQIKELTWAVWATVFRRWGRGRHNTEIH